MSVMEMRAYAPSPELFLKYSSSGMLVASLAFTCIRTAEKSTP
jgi:hypothetical protein